MDNFSFKLYFFKYNLQNFEHINKNQLYLIKFFDIIKINSSWVTLQDLFLFKFIKNPVGFPTGPLIVTLKQMILYFTTKNSLCIPLM